MKCPTLPVKVDVKQIGMEMDEADDVSTSDHGESASAGRESTLQVCCTSNYYDL